MSITGAIRKVVRKCGWDIIKYIPGGHPLARREKLLQEYGVTVVLDVGANIGQYGSELREIGYRGKIISFEPLHSAFAELTKASAKDNNWYIHNYALGDVIGKVKINIAENSFSSSIVDMLPAHIKYSPDSKYVGEQETQIKTLDLIFPSLCHPDEKIYLKLDTQGFEENVLRGAERSLQYIDTIQIEMSLVPLYRDSMLFEEIYQYLKKLGYNMVSVEPAFTDGKTGQLLQVDSIFHRL